jgi:hypothetical protein
LVMNSSVTSTVKLLNFCAKGFLGPIGTLRRSHLRVLGTVIHSIVHSCHGDLSHAQIEMPIVLPL